MQHGTVNLNPFPTKKQIMADTLTREETDIDELLDSFTGHTCRLVVHNDEGAALLFDAGKAHVRRSCGTRLKMPEHVAISVPSS